MNGPLALCEAEGDALRRALAVAFADDALAARRTAAAFARARRHWRAVAALSDPMAWIDATAVRGARRPLAVRERRWRPGGDAGADLLAPLRPRARVAVVLHAVRARTLDDIAVALVTTRTEVQVLLRDAYRTLGVVDVDLADDVMPYAD